MTLPRILITGGAGFVGTNLVLALYQKFDIVVLDNLSTGSENLPLILDKVRFIKGDIKDRTTCVEALSEVDYVVHLAAKGSVVESMQDPFSNLNDNVFGTLNLLSACASMNVKQFVFSSTGGALMGNCQLPVNESSIPKPISPYGASKMACEGYCSAFSDNYELPITILRFGNVYGSYSTHKKGFVNQLMHQAINDEVVTVFGDGSASRDFVHVSDICRAIEAGLLSQNESLQTFHIGTEIETNLNELIQIISDLNGKPISVVYENARKGEVKNNVAQGRLAKHVLGFEPKVTIQNGLSSMWDWFESIKNK